jgi:hypothetical protein
MHWLLVAFLGTAHMREESAHRKHEKHLQCTDGAPLEGRERENNQFLMDGLPDALSQLRQLANDEY